jgi:AcrR family transcriptional regulator
MSPRTTEQFEAMRIESKDRIIKSALKLFSSKGFFNTSIREIAKEANVSDGLLYNYFKSKESLAIAVMRSAFDTIDEMIIANNDQNPEVNIQSSIQNFIRLIENELDKIRLLAQMGFHKEKFEILNQLTVEKYESSVNKFHKNLKLLGVPNPKSEARFLVAILDGLVFEFLLMDNPFDIKKFKQNLINKYCKS